MRNLAITVILTVGVLPMSGCMTYGMVDAARGQEDEKRPLLPSAKDIQPLSASTDGTYIQVCFRVSRGANEIIYTAESPDPEGYAKSELPSVGPFEIRSLKHGCHQRGQSINLHPDLTESWPNWESARGVYPMSGQGSFYPYYNFVYRSGKNTGSEISILKADQFKARVNTHPFYYLAVPFTLVADIVVTPLFLLWMSSCGSCK